MCGSSALLSVLLVGLAAALASSSDLFDNQLGDINYCKKQCLLTIKNKSPAKVSWPHDITAIAAFSPSSLAELLGAACLCGKPQHQQQTGRYILLVGEPAVMRGIAAKYSVQTRPQLKSINKQIKIAEMH